MMGGDERFFAWLDSELAGAEADAMAAKVAAEPELQRLAAQHRGLRERLEVAFGPIAEEPVPEGLLAAARDRQPEIVDLSPARHARGARRWALPQWAAMAATLAVGILVGSFAFQREGAPVELANDKIYAAASLDRALDTQLASAPSGDIRIGLTFRSRSGTLCRSFTGPASSGLACRDGERWQVRGLFAAPEGQQGPYRMASGLNPNLASMIDSSMADEPLDAAAERAARDSGWR
jgi:anti-sigma factor RsiW